MQETVCDRREAECEKDLQVKGGSKEQALNTEEDHERGDRGGTWENIKVTVPFDRGRRLAQERRMMTRSAKVMVGGTLEKLADHFYGRERRTRSKQNAVAKEQYLLVLSITATVGDRRADLPKTGMELMPFDPGGVRSQKELPASEGVWVPRFAGA